MGKYMDIFNNYEDYSRKAFRDSALMRTLFSSGEMIASSLVNRNLKVDPVNRVTPRTTRLQRPNLRGEAIRDIDKGLNTFMQTTYESGGRPTGDLFSRYANAVTKAGIADATMKSQIATQEEGMNLQSQSQADQINANIDAQNVQARNKLRMIKDQNTLNSLRAFDQGIMAIAQGRSNLETALASSEAQARYYDDMYPNNTRGRNRVPNDTGSSKNNNSVPNTVERFALNNAFDVIGKISEIGTNLALEGALGNVTGMNDWGLSYHGQNDPLGKREGFTVPVNANVGRFNPFVPYTGYARAPVGTRTNPFRNVSYNTIY